MVNFRNLLFWRPSCAKCQQRKGEFIDGLCFECVIDRMEDRFANDLLSAVASPDFVSVFRTLKTK